MIKSASIRDLRNHFPKVRKLVETEGEVLLTENGEARYRLTLYTPPPIQEPEPIDYWARLTSYQPEPISDEDARQLHEDNRGDR